MSIDKSLKSPGGIQRTRNVLTRGERIDQLIEEGRWQEGQSALGLPKVLVKRVVAGKKKKKKEEDAGNEQEAQETEET
ncbi:MAG: small basic protein [Fuerstiella sp.]|nr:small basic protein [Fuerstiella sp.]